MAEKEERIIWIGGTKMKKVYLETPEAVIKALKAGKEVRDENNYIFKIVDGFIVATHDDYFYIGYTIYGIDKPYILEEEPLKIEVGKFYKTRDGRKAFVYEKIKFDYPKPFCVVKAGKLDSYNVNADGKQEDNERPSDIVAPWEE